MHFLATVPLPADLQNIALQIMARENRWEVISRACLSNVSEQTRRSLFKAAVDRRQWAVVRQWADHSLYDDQRGWALEEAFNEKQWDVFMLLADHGLTQTELMRVRYKVAKYANWRTVRRMFERGADITEVRELMEGPGGSRKRTADFTPDTPRREKSAQLLQLENKWIALSNSFGKAVEACRWSVVLFHLTRTPNDADLQTALEAATKADAWHVVMQLVNKELTTAQRDRLLSVMVRRRQWSVCSVTGTGREC